MVRINLLPWREEERSRRLNEFFVMLGIGFVIASLIAFYVHIFVAGLIQQQTDRNQYLTGEITKLDSQIKEIEDLEKEKNSLIARMDVIQQLQESRPEIVHLFDELVNIIPDGVYLTSITQRGRALTLRGQAQSNARVSTYMGNIDKSQWLADAILEVIQQSAQKGGDIYSQFTLKAQQMDKSKPASEDTDKKKNKAK